MKHMLCFGCGYSSTHTARQLLPSGNWQITGTTRSDAARTTLTKQGIKGLIWPGSGLDEAIENATHWLVSIPPNEGKDLVIEYLEGVPDDHLTKLEWIGYFSTTAVYGDHDGTWVDENTPVNPTTQRGKYRVKAEKDWVHLANRLGVPLCIFRLAGIYGPGRGPLAQLSKGNRRKIIKKDQYFNRIHVEDIAGAVIKAMTSPGASGIFNLCDNLPARSDKVIDYGAELLGLPKPQGIHFANAELGKMARSFYSESKRVSNQKLTRNLGYDLLYPDYLQGMSALLKDLANKS